MSYQRLYTQVLHALPQAVCHCDRQGVICDSNLAAQTLLGYVPETLQQTPWLELIHVSDQALIENCWQYLQTQAEAPPCTVRCLCGSALQAAGNNDAGNNDGGNNDGGNNDAVSAYVSVGVTFTATYDGAGALEHVLLWLTGQASTRPR